MVTLKVPPTARADASTTWTVTAGLMVPPMIASLGCWTKAAASAAPVSLKAAEVTWSEPVEATSVYPTPWASIDRSSKVASPKISVVWVRVPLRVPPPGLAPRAIVIVNRPVTGLPSWSSTCTVIGGAITVLAGALTGPWMKTSWLAW